MTVTATSRADEPFQQPQPSRTPARLRASQLVATLAILLFALVAIGQVLQLRSDLAERPQFTAQGVRVSQLQAELVRAGRIAAVGALGGGSDGLESSLKTASGLVVEAAAAGADAGRLAAVNASLGQYASVLRQAAAGSDPARAAALLAEADRLLADALQPALDQLASGIGQRAAGAGWLAWALAAGGIAVIGVLGWAWLRSSQLSHRVISPGLALAAVLVAGMTVLVVNTAATATSGGSSDALRQAAGLTRIQSAVETSATLQARAALTRQFTADQAKAELTARQDAAKAVDKTTPADVRRAASTAVDALAGTAGLLAKASWPEASAALRGPAGADLPKNLAALASASAGAGDQLVQAAEQAPASEATAMAIVAVGLALLAVAAAVAVDRGIGVRLKEYQ